MSWWPRALWFLIDLIAPRPQPLNAQQLQQQSKRRSDQIAESSSRIGTAPDDAEQLQRYLQALTELLKDDKERSQSVETRLTTIMGFASLAGTIVFGCIVTQIFSKTSVASMQLRLIAIAGEIYLTLQLCVAISASIKGLQRRTYLRPETSDVLPQANESEQAHLRNRMRQLCRMIDDQGMHTNDKVTWMAVAHRATQNFIGALLLLAVIAGYFVTRQNDGADGELISTLRTNRELYNELRGPPGVAGPKGAPGERGPTGERGQSCRYEVRPSGKPHAAKLSQHVGVPKDDLNRNRDLEMNGSGCDGELKGDGPK
jgi:hypothetical protein